MDKIAPCTYDMSEVHITTTCPKCQHSAFVHIIEADGCILCHVDSTRDDIREMLEEMSGLMTEFLQTTKRTTPRAATGAGKLKRRKHHHESS